MLILMEIFNLAMMNYFHFNSISYFYSARQKIELNREKKNQKYVNMSVFFNSEQNLKKIIMNQNVHLLWMFSF